MIIICVFFSLFFFSFFNIYSIFQALCLSVELLPFDFHSLVVQKWRILKLDYFNLTVFLFYSILLDSPKFLICTFT